VLALSRRQVVRCRVWTWVLAELMLRSMSLSRTATTLPVRLLLFPQQALLVVWLGCQEWEAPPGLVARLLPLALALPLLTPPFLLVSTSSPDSRLPRTFHSLFTLEFG